MYATIIASLQEYENQKIEEWGRDVEASSQAKLKLPLLIRDLDKSLLNVNFDPALVKLLREVKYFLLLGLTVPDSALEVYKQVEIFRRWTGNLDLIVNMNNDVLLQLLPVEKPLVRPYLDKFDRVINAGLSQMNWNSVGINEFIEESMEQVRRSLAGKDIQRFCNARLRCPGQENTQTSIDLHHRFHSVFVNHRPPGNRCARGDAHYEDKLGQHQEGPWCVGSPTDGTQAEAR